MSEQQSQPSGGDGESGDESSSSLEPGGGPQRVVSEKSVDDILSSLDETRPGSESEPASSEPAAESDRLESEGTTVEFDEADVPEPPTESESASDPDPVPDSSDVGPDAASESEGETEAEGEGTSETGTTAGDRDAPDATDASPSVEDAAASLSAATGPNSNTDEAGASGTTADAAGEATGEDGAVDSDDDSDSSSDPTADAAADLTALIEQGDVTGADVREAEAGEGRDPTPEVDEIDLSMDDLETTATGGTGTGGSNATDDAGGDAGPLAGSIDADSNESESESENETDESPGLLGRIKRFFS